ncbi:MAG: pilus assembly protein [Anaerolineae bacterium]
MLHLSVEEGAGSAEYALILALVVIIVLALLMILGPQIGNTFSGVTSNLERTGTKESAR